MQGRIREGIDLEMKSSFGFNGVQGGWYEAR
jgi:hypothetical protein